MIKKKVKMQKMTSQTVISSLSPSCANFSASVIVCGRVTFIAEVTLRAGALLPVEVALEMAMVVVVGDWW